MHPNRSHVAFRTSFVVIVSCAAACSTGAADPDASGESGAIAPSTTGDPSSLGECGPFAGSGGASDQGSAGGGSSAGFPTQGTAGSASAGKGGTSSKGGAAGKTAGASGAASAGGSNKGGSDTNGGTAGVGNGTGGSSGGDPFGAGGDGGTGNPGNAGSGGSPFGGSAGSTGNAGSSSDGGAAGAGSDGPSSTDYAPYFYTWGWGDSSDYLFGTLVDLQSQSHISGVTLAFVLSDGGCAATTDIQTHLDDVTAFRAAGGKVKASFGGANGTYLENACKDASSMATVVAKFVTDTGITDLDFDVEQPGAMNDAVNALRGQALATVQTQTGAKISFTLGAVPTDPNGLAGGLEDAGMAVVKAAIDAGVTVSHVNLMTMDYGGWYSDGQKMGDLAVSCVEDARSQLQSLLPSLSDQDAYAMLGATPMIGQNDVDTETFGLDDAKTLADFAIEKHLGLIAFWAIQRDQAGKGDLGLYSQVNTSNYQFHQVFSAVAK